MAEALPHLILSINGSEVTDMKKTILNILQVVIKSVLIVALFFASFTYLNRVFYNRDVDRGISFHNLPKDSLDVLVLGSSHAQYSFIPSIFYEDTGLYSYVLGSACQPLEVSVEMLKEALKTQSPKLVILEGYTALPLHITSCLADSCYVTAEYQMRGEEKYNTISYLPEEKAEAYYNDFFAYHNDWKTLEDWKALRPDRALAPNNVIDPECGYVFEVPYYPISNYWGPVYAETEAGELVKQDEESLNEILRICKENGIELYLYKTSIDQMDKENWAMLKALWKWADENGVAYFDLMSNAERLGYYMQVHSDGFHSFIHGATFITDMLGELTGELGIDYDHHENKRMEELYRSSAQDYTAESLHYEEDPLKVLRRLKNSRGYVVLRYIPSSYAPSDALYNALIDAGFKDYDPGLSYYAVLHDGEIVYSGQQEIDTEIAGQKVVIDRNGVTLGENVLTSEGLMTIAFMSENGNRKGFLDVEYRGVCWRIGGYNYEDLFQEWRFQ